MYICFFPSNFYTTKTSLNVKAQPYSEPVGKLNEPVRQIQAQTPSKMGIQDELLQKLEAQNVAELIKHARLLQSNHV